MKLLIQPNDGITALLEGIRNAKKSIEIAIFRLDKKEIENALKAAIGRGVNVKALVAYTSRDGEQSLRKLEQRLLEAGVTVTRTADDLVRYHNKLMIIDRSTLYLLAFNYTTIDIDYSRSFGIITKDQAIVEEAARLFEADSTRQPYVPALDNFIVSPLNARKQLAAFIKGAEEELLIYDNQLSDREMIGLLKNRAKAGVKIRILGNVGKVGAGFETRKMSGLRLHTRTIIRDGREAFLGSQSLRKVELDGRREVGIITNNLKIVQGMSSIFELDWIANERTQAQSDNKTVNLETTAKAAKKAVKTLVHELPTIISVIQGTAVEAVSESIEAGGTKTSVENVVQDVVMKAVQDIVRDVIRETVTDLP